MSLRDHGHTRHRPPRGHACPPRRAPRCPRPRRPSSSANPEAMAILLDDHPQRQGRSDGAVERLIKSLVQQLAILCRHDQHSWDLQVPLVMLSLRVAPHASTGVSPAMMMFGRDVNPPPSLARGHHPHQPVPRMPRCDYPALGRSALGVEMPD
ncbi:Transmembrane protein 245 [Frankliniella fusca]|uniref:Transmembrane protein 245 n=1 Tax=Frankliniella fusca TaxID=407009 RepID=A0AAE1HXW0_9NEOP|nr:Transmembrane protein 245 [Frankliniella fusca]